MEYRQIPSKVRHFPTIVPPNRFWGKGVRFGYSTVSFRAPFLGSPAKSRVYAYNLANLNKKNLMSTTPLSCALNSLILALKDSAAALVDLRS